ncbi:MAG: haloacid dehalogenase [Hyphomicrobiales bacterium]|nr:MAG: haloacid dehalogenase [Hyphomicrobiales bacterium]
MKPQLVIFDCDGVLVDSEPAANEILSGNLRKYGLDMSPQQCLDQLVGGKMSDVKDRVEQMGANLPADWTDEIYREIYARMKAGIPLIEGIVEVLDALDAAQIPYCVASNGSEEKMGITLGQNNLLSRFEGATFSAHTVGLSKPHPGLFLHAAKTLDVLPKNCVVVEDSLTGVTAARRAIMPCFGFAEHNDGAKLAAEKATVFHKMSELSGLLEL